MVALGPLNTPPAVIQLTPDHELCDPAAGGRIIRYPVLLSAQQHIPGFHARRPRQKSAARRAEAQADIAFGTGPHQSGRSPGIGEADDLFQIVQRKPPCLLLFPADNDIFAVECQIGILRGDKQSVEQSSHGISSICLCR